MSLDDVGMVGERVPVFEETVLLNDNLLDKVLGVEEDVEGTVRLEEPA